MFHVIEYSAALLALGCVLWLPGFAIVRIVPSLAAGGALSGLGQVCLGITAWAVASFALCALGQWHVASFKALVVAAVAAALWAGARRRPAGRRYARPATSPDERWFAGAIGVLLGALYLVAMGPEISWDASSYHLTIPKLYLEAGGFRPIEMNVYSNWPLFIQLIFSTAMLALDYVLAKLIHFGFGLLTLWAIVVACREFHRRESGVIGAGLLLACPVVIFELTVAYIDLAQAFLLLSATLFMLRAKGGGESAPTALLLSGICCGALMGTKIMGLSAAAAVSALYAPELLRAARSGTLAATFGGFAARFALPAAALGAPWMLKAAWVTGNPIYPFYFDALGGADWSARLGVDLAHWQSIIGMGRAPLDHLLLPMRVILQGGEVPPFGEKIGVLWIALLPLSLAFGLRVRLVRCCLAVAGLYYGVWSISAQDSRYLMPILPLLAIASGVTLVELIDRWLAPARRRTAIRALLASIAAGLLWVNSGSLVAGLRYAVVYQMRSAELTHSAVHPVFRFINRELPGDARLLFLNTNQGFFCNREYLADSFFQASQISDWLGGTPDPLEVGERLRKRGITHVLRFDQDWGLTYPAALTQLLDDRTRAVPVYRSADRKYQVFALLELTEPETDAR